MCSKISELWGDILANPEDGVGSSLAVDAVSASVSHATVFEPQTGRLRGDEEALGRIVLTAVDRRRPRSIFEVRSSIYYSPSPFVSASYQAGINGQPAVTLKEVECSKIQKGADEQLERMQALEAPARGSRFPFATDEEVRPRVGDEHGRLDDFFHKYYLSKLGGFLVSSA